MRRQKNSLHRVGSGQPPQLWQQVLEVGGLVLDQQRRRAVTGSEDAGNEQGVAALSLIAHTLELAPSGSTHTQARKLDEATREAPFQPWQRH